MAGYLNLFIPNLSESFGSRSNLQKDCTKILQIYFFSNFIRSLKSKNSDQAYKRFQDAGLGRKKFVSNLFFKNTRLQPGFAPKQNSNLTALKTKFKFQTESLNFGPMQTPSLHRQILDFKFSISAKVLKNSCRQSLDLSLKGLK